MLVLAAMLALIGACAYFALQAKNSAGAVHGWKTRVGSLQRTLAQRTGQLNSANAANEQAARELSSLNGEVKALETQVNGLVAAKAKVTDQQGVTELQAAQLAKLASEQQSCSDGLSQVITHVSARDFGWVNANVTQVSALCSQAQTDFTRMRSGG